jgi:hypothetical protein
MPSVRLIKHEAVPHCGSFEIRFPDDRPSKYVYWDDLPGRRLQPDRVDRAVAERVAKIIARAEQHALNQDERGEIGPDLFSAPCDMGLEGLVSKRPISGRQVGAFDIQRRTGVTDAFA